MTSIWPLAEKAENDRPRSRQQELGASDTVCARRAAYVLHGYERTDPGGDKHKAILGTWLHEGMLSLARREWGWLTERRVESPWLRGHIDAVQLDSETAARLPARLRPRLPAEQTTVEDIKTKGSRTWSRVLRYGATDAERRQVLLYAGLLESYGFADVVGQRQLARLGPVKVGRIRFRFINRDSGEEHVQELPCNEDQIREAGAWVATVRASSSPEEIPRTHDGPGLSVVCDNCSWRTECWGVGDPPQSVLVRSDADREKALSEYVEASEQAAVIKRRMQMLRRMLDGAPPGVYGRNRLSWSGDRPVETEDVAAMEALFHSAGVPVPMAPDVRAMSAQLAAAGIAVPRSRHPSKRTPRSINVTPHKG